MITRNAHLPCALACSNCRVTAIVDPVMTRATELIRAYGLDARAVARAEDIVGDVDGVIIATPNDTHRDLAVMFLERGISTLIEKPLAGSVAEGEDILAAARGSGAIVAMGYSTRFRDHIILLKDLLDGGYFGKIRRFVHQFGTTGGWAPLSAYTLSRRAAGGGVLVITGTHFLDRMMYFWGYPSGAALIDDSRGGPEANCAAEFRFEGNGQAFSGLTRYSKAADLPSGLVIDTEAGIVRVLDSDTADIVLRHHDRPDVEHVVRRAGPPVFDPDVPVCQHQIADFVEAARSRTAPLVNGEQGLASLRLLEHLYSNRRPMPDDWYGSEKPAPAP